MSQQNPGKLIAWFTFILGLVALLGGITTAILRITGASEISIFGQKINTVSVGLAMFVVGIIMVVRTFKKILESPLETDKADKSFYITLYSANNSAEFIQGATIKLFLSPEVKTKITDGDGRVFFNYNYQFENESVDIVISKTDYLSIKQTIELKNNKDFKIPFYPEKKKSSKF